VRRRAFIHLLVAFAVAIGAAQADSFPRLADAAGQGSIRRVVTIDTIDAGRVPPHATAATDPAAIGASSARRSTPFHSGILPTAAVLAAPGAFARLARTSAAGNAVLSFRSSSVRGPPAAL
jgi:hypothetical protein